MSGSHDQFAEKRARLILGFRDRETREGYAEGFLHTWISTQLAAVRQQRGLTQAQLADLVGTQQPGIARMERDSYGKWNLTRLMKVAHALGCRLKVSLESYGSLVEEAVGFRSTEYLLRPDFEHDPVFQALAAAEPTPVEGPIDEMRVKMLRWFDERAPREQLQRWLQGYDLPAVGDEESPVFWISAGLSAHKEHRDVLIERVQDCLDQCGKGSFSHVRWQEEYQVNLFDLSANLRAPAAFRDQLGANHSRLERTSPIMKIRPGLSLLNAMVLNQNSGHFQEIWRQRIERADTESLYQNLRFGLRGMAWTPDAPSDHALTEGVHIAGRQYLQGGWPVDVFERSLRGAFGDMWKEFRERAPRFPDAACTHVHKEGGRVPEVVLNAMTASLPDDCKARWSKNTDQFQMAVNRAMMATA